MPLTFSTAELIALCAESVLYGMHFICISRIRPHYSHITYLGAYLVMFLEHLEVIFSTHRQRAFGTGLRLPVVLATSTIFALVTSVCINSCRIWEVSH